MTKNNAARLTVRALDKHRRGSSEQQICLELLERCVELAIHKVVVDWWHRISPHWKRSHSYNILLYRKNEHSPTVILTTHRAAVFFVERKYDSLHLHFVQSMSAVRFQPMEVPNKDIRLKNTSEYHLVWPCSPTTHCFSGFPFMCIMKQRDHKQRQMWGKLMSIQSTRRYLLNDCSQWFRPRFIHKPCNMQYNNWLFWKQNCCYRSAGKKLLNWGYACELI